MSRSTLNVLTSNEIGVFGYLSIGASMIAIIAILFDIFSNKTKIIKDIYINPLKSK